MIDVIIPTLGRADKLPALIANLEETAPAARPLLVLDQDDYDSWDAVREMRVPALQHNGGYPQKSNAGFKETSQSLVLIAGDDVVFHKCWLEAALAALKDPAIQVIAPNDASPSAGLNATFPIFRRSYVETLGAAWGEPGNVYHEGYRHNFTDTELWELAKWRGCARYVPECVIEHRHPVWEKAEVDATYRQGGMNAEKWAHDEALFNERHRSWLVA